MRSSKCSVSRALAVVGDRWTLLVLREAFYGVRRFDEFHRNLGVARPILSARLRNLVDHGLLSRAPYQEPGHRLRYEYHLTEKGRALFETLAALMQWGDTYLADATGPPVRLLHAGCGGPVRVSFSCASCGPLTGDDGIEARLSHDHPADSEDAAAT